MPPSPTAAAQRFTEPERTSPAAKMPGRLVSSGPARAASFHAGAPATAWPVLMKPFSSRLDLGRQPVGAGLCADHGKDGRRLHGSPFVRLRVLQFHGFENFPPIIFRISVCGRDLDVLLRLDAPRRDNSTCSGQTFAADHEQHLSPRLRRETSRPAPPSCRRRRRSRSSCGRVGLPAPWPRSKRRQPSKSLAPLGIQTMVIRTRRDDDALRPQNRVAPFGLRGRAVLAIREGASVSACDGRGKLSRRNDRPEAARCRSARRR